MLVAGVSFAIGQFAVSNYVGPELTDTLAALFSLASVALLLKFWQPERRLRRRQRRRRSKRSIDPPRRVWRAYATYGILVVTVLIGQSRQLRRHVAGAAAGERHGAAALRPGRQSPVSRAVGRPDRPRSTPQAFRFPVWDFNWPGAYQMVDGKPMPIVQREAPVVAQTTPYALTYRLDFLATAGTLVLFATFIALDPDGGRRARGRRSLASRSARPSRSCGCRS